MIHLDVLIEDGRWAALGKAEVLARRAVEGALTGAGYDPAVEAEVSVLMADDQAVRALNRDWRGQDRPTNVLSFPAPEEGHGPGPRHLGDLALAYETLAREALEEGKSLQDHALHLIVHGTLHLLGYDHESEGEAAIMEELETEILARLGVANPYRDVAL